MPLQPRDQISSLPIEIKTLITEFLPAADVKNLRLTCTQWAPVVKGLFNVADGESIFPGLLSVHPGILDPRSGQALLDDMSRMVQISHRAEVAEHVRWLEIFVADFDLAKFAEELRRRGRRRTDEEYDLWLDRLTALVSEQQETHCDPESVSGCLSRFPQLRSLVISSTVYPFTEIYQPLETEMFKVWDFYVKTSQGLDCEDPEYSRERYSGLLLALCNHLPHFIDTLDMDRVPLAAFAFGEQARTSAESSPETRLMGQPGRLTVRNFRLGIFQGVLDDVPRYASLAVDFVAAFQNIESLDLSFFSGSRGADPSWRESFHSLLQRLHFPRLTGFRLSHLDVPSELLLTFTARHAATLRHLSINGSDGRGGRIATVMVSFHSESTEALLTALRDSLALEKFELFFRGDQDRLYDEEWKTVAAARDASSNEGLWPDAAGLRFQSVPNWENTEVHLLENYVLGLCSWPMEEDRPSRTGYWKRLPLDAIEKVKSPRQ